MMMKTVFSKEKAVFLYRNSEQGDVKVKKYLVCFYYWKDFPTGQITGFGNMDVDVNPEIDIYTSSGVDNLIQFIKEKKSYDGCVILNFIPLNG